MGSDLLLAWHFAHLGVFVVGCLQTTLRYGQICSVCSGVIAMITEASNSDNPRTALAYVNNLPETTSHWPCDPSIPIHLSLKPSYPVLTNS